jgi:hypothetical protein
MQMKSRRAPARKKRLAQVLKAALAVSSRNK